MIWQLVRLAVIQGADLIMDATTHRSSSIERHFAWAKRYFGLEAACWQGISAAYQNTALVYAATLGVALVAHRFQRPELVGSRSRVLAPTTLS